MKTKNILLVDPFGSNFAYAAETRLLNHNTFAMLSTPVEDIPKGFIGQYTPGAFKKVFTYNFNVNSFKVLKRYNIDAVIPCDQLSLRITDYISDYLRLPGNPSESIKARVNKGLARKMLQDRGICDVKYLQSDDVNEIINWSEKTGYPVILKPPESAGGSIYVKKCTNSDEIRSTFNLISGMDGTFERNITGEVLAEEYLDGEEYIVNMMHLYGEIYPVAIAGVDKIQRRGNASIYKNVYSLDLNSQTAREIFNYTKKISKALDIRYGINDTEVKYTSKGVRLVEMNNRMSGAKIPYAIDKCTGFNPHRENIRLLSGEKQFPDIRYKKDYNICFLINNKAGIVKSVSGLKEISNLKSYDHHEIYAEKGAFSPETTDLINSWGKVILVNSDREQLKKDTEFVHKTLELVMDEN